MNFCLVHGFAEALKLAVLSIVHLKVFQLSFCRKVATTLCWSQSEQSVIGSYDFRRDENFKVISVVEHCGVNQIVAAWKFVGRVNSEGEGRHDRLCDIFVRR
jgi:hypothetical protein